MGVGEHRPPPEWLRAFRSLWQPFLSRADKKRIVAAIAESERRTSGEIHVHVTAYAGRGDMLALAARRFHALGLQRTRERNGVLILVSRLDQRFAIFGDRGLHARPGMIRWENAGEALGRDFADGHYADGIIACVQSVGEQLARLFPGPDGPNPNQLPDTISQD